MNFHSITVIEYSKRFERKRVLLSGAQWKNLKDFDLRYSCSFKIQDVLGGNKSGVDITAGTREVFAQCC